MCEHPPHEYDLWHCERGRGRGRAASGRRRALTANADPFRLARRRAGARRRAARVPADPLHRERRVPVLALRPEPAARGVELEPVRALPGRGLPGPAQRGRLGRARAAARAAGTLLQAARARCARRLPGGGAAAGGPAPAEARAHRLRPAEPGLLRAPVLRPRHGELRAAARRALRAALHARGPRAHGSRAGRARRLQPAGGDALRPGGAGLVPASEPAQVGRVRARRAGLRAGPVLDPARRLLRFVLPQPVPAQLERGRDERGDARARLRGPGRAGLRAGAARGRGRGRAPGARPAAARHLQPARLAVARCDPGRPRGSQRPGHHDAVPGLVAPAGLREPLLLAAALPGRAGAALPAAVHRDRQRPGLSGGTPLRRRQENPPPRTDRRGQEVTRCGRRARQRPARRW